MERSLSKLAVHNDGGVERKARTWVLVIHYAFENSTTMQPRDFNHKDLQRLQQTFHSYSNCTYKELKSPSSKLIPHHLSERGIKEQFPSDKEGPTIFILFILSHGGENGVIYTDKYDEYFMAETFTTSEVFKYLEANSFLENSLKMLFFEPCKGNLMELRLPTLQSDRAVSPHSIKVLAEPTKKNFVIFNAAIESTVACANLETGSWLVMSFCNALGSLEENVSLLELFRRITRNISSMASMANHQMPQFSVFPHANTIFRKRASMIRTESDKGQDGISVNSFDTFTWRSEQGLIFKRGQALIFSHTSPYSKKLSKVLEKLNFQIECVKLSQTEETLANIAMNGMTDREGSLLVVVICSLLTKRETTENQLEVVAFDGSELVPIGVLARKFLPSNCHTFATKPKIFIFLDPECYSENVYVPAMAKGMHDIPSCLNHEDFLIATCYGEVSLNKLIDGLELMHQSKISTLQDAILQAINANSLNGRVGQLWSTMTKKLSFPKDVDVYRPHLLEDESNETMTCHFKDFTKKLLEGDKQLVLVHGNVRSGKSRFAKEVHTQLVIKFSGSVVLAKLNARPEFLTKCVPSIETFLKQFVDMRKWEFVVRSFNDKQMFVIIDEWSDLQSEQKNAVPNYLHLFREADVRVLMMIKSEENVQFQEMMKIDKTLVQSFDIVGESMANELELDAVPNIQAPIYNDPVSSLEIQPRETIAPFVHDARVTWVDGCLLAQGSCIVLSKVMDDVLREGRKMKQVVLCASRRLCIDRDLTLKHTHLALMVPIVEVVDEKRTIQLLGETGKQHEGRPKPSISPDAPGAAGLDGNPGFSSGSFLLVALDVFHSERLSVLCEGGKGGDGQLGGDGWSGVGCPFPVFKIPANEFTDVRTPVDFVRWNCKEQGYEVAITNTSLKPPKQGQPMGILEFDVRLKSFPEKRPTDGGRGGAGGPGAIAGKLKLAVQNGVALDDIESSSKTGQGGEPGEGGRAGKNAPGKFRTYGCRFESRLLVDYRRKPETIKEEGECESCHQNARDGPKGPEAVEDDTLRYRYVDGLLPLVQSFVGTEEFASDNNTQEFKKYFSTQLLE